mgnify:CR=1 FL=1
MNLKKEMDSILKKFLDGIPSHLPICTLAYPKSNSVTFVRDSKYALRLSEIEKSGLTNLHIIAKEDLELPSIEGVTYYRTPNVDILFTLYANHVHDGIMAKNNIHSSAVIEPSAVIGAEGISAADYKHERVFFRHHGNVKICERFNTCYNSIFHSRTSRTRATAKMYNVLLRKEIISKTTTKYV